MSTSLTCSHLSWVHQVELVVQRQDLYGTEGVQQMGIMPWAAPKTPILLLAAHDPCQQLLLVQLVLLPEQV